jgi:hypothetical protein
MVNKLHKLIINEVIEPVLEIFEKYGRHDLTSDSLTTWFDFWADNGHGSDTEICVMVQDDFILIQKDEKGDHLFRLSDPQSIQNARKHLVKIVGDEYEEAP